MGDPAAPGPPRFEGLERKAHAAVVDVVHNVFMTREVLRAPPPLGGGEDTRGIAGVLSRGGTQGADGGLVFVLDLDRLRRLTEPIRGASWPAPGGA